MYPSPAIYCAAAWRAVSSSVIRNEPRAVSIRELLTVAHEANIRMELHYNLAEQGNRHHASKEHGVERKANWYAFCQFGCYA